MTEGAKALPCMWCGRDWPRVDWPTAKDPATQRVLEAAKNLYNFGPCTVVTGSHQYADAYAISKETMDPLFDAVEALEAREKNNGNP